jgi:signal peptidase I
VALDTDTRANPEQEQPKPEEPEQKSKLGFFGELPILIITALVLALLIKAFLFQAFYIPSGSMEPTLMPGDRVLVNKIPYYFHDPRRGDVIVFENPTANADRGIVGGFVHWLAQGLGVSGGADEDYIKRVIGLPGDHITCANGAVFINGNKLLEPYETQRTQCQPATVPAGRLFVMGDNRSESNDSRYELGTVPLGKVVGKAFVIMWPPSNIGLLH